MRRLLVMLCLLLSGCQRDPDRADALPPTAAYSHLSDKIAAQFLRWGIPWRLPCYREAGDQCFRFTEPQHLRGMWRNAFEGSRFCDPGRSCPAARESNFIWLEMKQPLPGWEDTPPGGLYAIDFIGRRSERGGLFGGQAGTDKEVIVDRLISIREVEAPAPGQMTRDVVEAYRQACRGAQMCMPNAEAHQRNIQFFVPGDHVYIM